MGFWDVVGTVLSKATEIASDMMEREREKRDRLMREVNREASRMQGRSSEDLASTLRDKKQDIKKRAAAKCILESRNNNQGCQRPNQAIHGDIKSNKNTADVFTSPAFRKGDNHRVKTTIVLSAPGQAEEKAGRPAAGQTGKTLKKAINELHKKDPLKFPSNRLDDYTIVNAVEEVHYKGKTGRTEARDAEISNSDNLKRVRAALADAVNVVALGDKAQLAVAECGYQGNVYKGEHPSMQALNRKYKSHNETPQERNSDRVTQWAEDMYNS